MAYMRDTSSSIIIVFGAVLLLLLLLHTRYSLPPGDNCLRPTTFVCVFLVLGLLVDGLDGCMCIDYTHICEVVRLGRALSSTATRSFC